MLSIAITGSFASGKTYILNLLSEEGYLTFSCDKCVSNLYKDEKIHEKILNLIPDLKVFDKKKLAEIIYNDENAKEKIESLIHPVVLKHIEDFRQNNIHQKFIFFEVPLLFEANWQKHFDFVITTCCSEARRLRHAKLKTNFNQEMYDKLEKIQIPQDEKIKKADFVINTDAKMIELKAQITNILEKL